VGCGRFDFDRIVDANHDVGSDLPVAAVTWVGTFVQQAVTTPTSIDTFTARAVNAGDAITLHVACDTGAQPPAVTVTAAGWSFTQLTLIAGVSTKWATAFGAIAPDTAPATFTVTWSATCPDLDELGDEFANADPTGGTTTFDGQAGIGGTTSCTPALTTASAEEAVWAACSQSGTAVSVSAGYTKSADDGHDDWTAYRPTTDPVNTPEAVTFTNTGGMCAATALTIRPR